MSAGWLIGALAVYGGARYASVVVHELAHAVAALAVGYRIESIQLGSRPSTGDATRPTGSTTGWPRVSVSWNLYRGGETRIRPRTGMVTSGRFAVFLAAGAMANLVVAGLLSWWAMTTAAAQPASLFMFSAASASLVVAVRNVLPAPRHRPMTDGHKIGRLWRYRAAALRWADEVPPVKPRRSENWIRIQGSTEIAMSQPDVFNFSYEPENAHLIDDTIVSAERVPGTPRGVGEVHRLRVTTDGGETTPHIFILKFEPPQRVLLRSTSVHTRVQVFTQEEVFPRGDMASTLVHTTWLEPSEAGWDDEQVAKIVDQVERFTESYLANVRAAIERQAIAPAIGANE